jgi:hypothetical protein
VTVVGSDCSAILYMNGQGVLRYSLKDAGIERAAEYQDGGAVSRKRFMLKANLLAKQLVGISFDDARVAVLEAD